MFMNNFLMILILIGFCNEIMYQYEYLVVLGDNKRQIE